MKKLYLSQIENGSPISHDLYNSHGAILVPKGKIMTPKLREQLLRNNIDSFSVDITGYEQVEDHYEHFDESVIREIEAVKKVYNDSFAALSSELEIFKRHQHFSKATMRETAKELVESIGKYKHVYLGLEGIRRKDVYTYIHSLDVAIFMIVLGKTLTMNKNDLEQAALAGLLHDIGKTAIDDSILLKPAKLSFSEMETMKKHSEIGYDILKNKLHYPEFVARVALEHHERVDMQGYPRKLNWDHIHLFSKMAAICDVYDAITAERIYKRAMLPHDAIEYLMTIVGTHLDQALTTQFIRNIVVYPLGTRVRLNSGEIGIVVRLHDGYPTRPVVKCIENRALRDLMIDHTIFVDQVCYSEN